MKITLNKILLLILVAYGASLLLAVDPAGELPGQDPRVDAEVHITLSNGNMNFAIMSDTPMANVKVLSTAGAPWLQGSDICPCTGGAIYSGDGLVGYSWTGGISLPIVKIKIWFVGGGTFSYTAP